jgi:hypothetical protein
MAGNIDGAFDVVGPSTVVGTKTTWSSKLVSDAVVQELCRRDTGSGMINGPLGGMVVSETSLAIQILNHIPKPRAKIV